MRSALSRGMTDAQICLAILAVVVFTPYLIVAAGFALVDALGGK